MLLRSARSRPLRLQTVEQAEERGYWVLMAAGATVAVGLLLTITLVFAFIGVPLLILGSLLAVGDLIWMLSIARRPVEVITCGVCEKPNRAFRGAGRFRCADCGEALLEQPRHEEAPVEEHAPPTVAA